MLQRGAQIKHNRGPAGSALGDLGGGPGLSGSSCSSGCEVHEAQRGEAVGLSGSQLTLIADQRTTLTRQNKSVREVAGLKAQRPG